MDSPLAQTRDHLIESLQRVERRTETLFLALGESLPELIDEMRASLAMSRSAVGCLDGAEGDGACGHEEAIRNLAEELSQDILSSATMIEQIAVRDEDLFAQLQAGIDQLGEIEAAIARIRSDSEEMQLVSLNAMTVALKAGAAGRAFSYITEELRRLAGTTITITDEVTGRGSAMLERFQRLEELLQSSREFQHGLLASFRERLQTALEEFHDVIGALVDGLRDLQQRSAELEGPVNRLMEAIQLQDLIRQSIDHIILSLRSFDPAHAQESTDRALDELAFMRRVPALARSLVEDVAAQIRNSAETFREATREAETRLNELEHERAEISAGRVARAGTKVELESTLGEASDALNELMGDLGTNMRQKDQLFARSNEIRREVEELDRQFRRFYPLVQRFHSIDVASRIEVAKKEALRSMGTRTERMTELTSGIEQDVESAIQTTQRFIGTTSSTIANHADAYRTEVSFFEAFRGRIEAYRDRLAQSRGSIVEIVRGFSLFTERFFAVFQRSTESGGELEELAASLEPANEELAAMEAMIEQSFRDALTERGLSDWSINNERLREIIDRFTIFTHKQRAGELVGLSVESGVEAGEVTLF